MHDYRVDQLRPSGLSRRPVPQAPRLRSTEPLAASLDDPRLASIVALKDRTERERTGLFQIEGLRFLLTAVEKRLPIEVLLYSPASLSHPGAEIVSHLLERGVRAIPTAPEILLAIANREDPQGMIAVTRQFTQPLEMSTPAAGLCWIAVDSIQSPGNLGTLIRSADCAGAAGLIAVDDGSADGPPRLGVDPYDPACVRGSMGAILDQRIVRATFDELRTWTRRHGGMIVGTSPSAKVDYLTAKYDRPTVIYLGSEKKGMSMERQHGCDLMVRIPMVGRSDSLNVGVAGSLMLYELFRQRRLVHRRRGRR